MTRGASSGEDRAVVNGAALRASIPSAFDHWSDSQWNDRGAAKWRRFVASHIGLVSCPMCHSHLIWTGFASSGPCSKCGGRGVIRRRWWQIHIPLPPTFYSADFDDWWDRQAQAIEAGTAETGPDSVHESAVGETDASDAALLADICDNMAEVLKPLPGIPDAPGQHAGTRATESGEGDEA
jgi:hypothetical protein